MMTFQATESLNFDVPRPSLCFREIQRNHHLGHFLSPNFEGQHHLTTFETMPPAAFTDNGCFAQDLKHIDT